MIIKVKVVPNSRKASVELMDDGSYKVRVDAKPVRGRANIRLIEILAEHFSAGKSGIQIIKGIKSKEKVVEINE